MIEPEVLLDKLESLGSPSAIANFFELEGIKGYIGRGLACPVTNYMIREGVIDEKKQFVFTSVKKVSLHKIGGDDLTYVDNPPNVRDFIRNFDDLKYLELVENGDQ